MSVLDDGDIRDLSAGVRASELGEGCAIDGTVNGEHVLIARSGGAVYAVGGRCTHYGARLADGLVAGDTIRCPLHHACFSLRDGDAACGPALDPIASYDVSESAGTIHVGAKREVSKRPAPSPRTDRPETIVILGTGAAGLAAAEMLRRRGYDRRLVMVGAETELPYDRPNLSKDFLAGTAPEEWLPLRSREFYRDNDIELMLGQRASALDPDARELRMLGGRSPRYDRLLIATGSEAMRLPVSTQGLRHVFTLRSLADARGIMAAAGQAKRAVVVGASFIGLEAAAALRARGIEVEVVSPTRAVFQHVFGPRLSRFVQDLHESNGVRFHFDAGVRSIDATHVTLVTGARLAADLVIVGVGARPSVALAQWAKLRVSDGVEVNELLETSRPDIFAAGDIARWPDRYVGESIRSEHWTVAMRQGQTAARNMLGEQVPFEATPFFWSQQYGVTVRYVGYQGAWDEIVTDGELAEHDCAIEYRRGGRLMAMATVGRELTSLQTEAAFESGLVEAAC